jgi:hypothetical protein
VQHRARALGGPQRRAIRGRVQGAATADRSNGPCVQREAARGGGAGGAARGVRRHGRVSGDGGVVPSAAPLPTVSLSAFLLVWLQATVGALARAAAPFTPVPAEVCLVSCRGGGVRSCEKESACPGPGCCRVLTTRAADPQVHGAFQHAGAVPALHRGDDHGAADPGLARQRDVPPARRPNPHLSLSDGWVLRGCGLYSGRGCAMDGTCEYPAACTLRGLAHSLAYGAGVCTIPGTISSAPTRASASRSC